MTSLTLAHPSVGWLDDPDPGDLERTVVAPQRHPHRLAVPHGPAEQVRVRQRLRLIGDLSEFSVVEQ